MNKTITTKILKQNTRSNFPGIPGMIDSLFEKGYILTTGKSDQFWFKNVSIFFIDEPSKEGTLLHIIKINEKKFTESKLYKEEKSKYIKKAKENLKIKKLEYNQAKKELKQLRDKPESIKELNYTLEYTQLKNKISREIFKKNLKGNKYIVTSANNTEIEIVTEYRKKDGKEQHSFIINGKASKKYVFWKKMINTLEDTLVKIAL